MTGQSKRPPKLSRAVQTAVVMIGKAQCSNSSYVDWRVTVVTDSRTLARTSEIK